MSDDAGCKFRGGERSEPQQRRRRRRPARAAGKRRPRSGPDAREEGRSARPSASDRSEAQGALARGADAGHRRARARSAAAAARWRPEERTARSTREEGGNRRSCEAEAAVESEANRCAPSSESVQPPDEHRTGWGTGQGRGSGGIAARTIRFAPAAIRLRAARRRAERMRTRASPQGRVHVRRGSRPSP